MYGYFRDQIFDGDILKSGMVVGALLSIISLMALWKLKETFHSDLNYSENQ
jgi:hypothetical protein